MFAKKVDHFLLDHGVDLTNKGVVIGVSGGPDSLALLHYLWTRREKWNLKIVAAHVDHMFRGEESFHEAKFVEQFCQSHQIPFEMRRINVPEIIAKTKKNPQVAARESRYQFFKEIMEDYHFFYLALGHHGDDQIETILMRLTRGTTGMARAGILFERPFSCGKIIRPLLCLTRDEIEEYCRINRLDPRRDPSNDKEVYSRNRFRKNVLPFLKSENPLVHVHFQRYSEELQSDEELLQELTAQKMSAVWKKEKGQAKLDIHLFRKMPMPLQRRGIQLILKYLYQERIDSLSAIHTDQLFSLIKSSKPSLKLDFPNGLKIIRSYNECRFQFGERKREPYRFELSETGTVHLPNGSEIRIDFHASGLKKTDANEIILNREEIVLPIIIRTRENGDRMTVKGMTGTKKIKDIFIDNKVPMSERDSWPIVTDATGRILWVPGLKKSNFAKNEGQKNSYIQLTYKSNDLV
jgi:tRNA(Ile)-lysidine synthase